MDRARIAASARLAGLELDAATDLTIAGSDRIFESPFHLGEGAAVALGLVGQAAKRLVAPPLRMSETPPHWEVPAARLGSGEPVWLLR